MQITYKKNITKRLVFDIFLKIPKIYIKNKIDNIKKP